jgi:TolA-binding protein
MKHRWLFLTAAAATLGMNLVGCSAPRTVERDRYFKPVIRRVQPLAPAPRVTEPQVAAAPTPDPAVKILEGALAESRRELLELRMEFLRLRDSVRIFGAMVRYQREASQTQADKLAVLEQQVATSQRPVIPAQPMPEPSTMARTEPSPASRPAPSTLVPSRGNALTAEAEYQEGVDLFNRRRYDDAHRWFTRLLSSGIREDLADNCEYWVGESDFARGQWTSAVESFERVVALRGSNKRADALLMLGRSLEMLRQTSRARAAYERLVREYPSSASAGIGRRKLRSMPADGLQQSSEGPVLS